MVLLLRQPDELAEVFHSAPDLIARHVAVPERIRDSFLQATGQGSSELQEVSSGSGEKRLQALGDDCPM